MTRLPKLLISILFLFLIKPVQWVLRFFRQKKIFFNIIIYYHSIPASEIIRFKRQLRLLKILTTIIPLGYHGDLSRSKRYLMITFDDAFHSMYKNAAPELLKCRVPFAIFVPTGKLGNKADWGKYTAGHHSEMVMYSEELIKLQNGLVSFGSHTVSHSSLISLSPEEAYREIKESKDALEFLLKREVKFFAFPYGYYDEKSVSLCRKAGYEQVFTRKIESPFAQMENYERGRIAVNPSDWHIEFIIKILGGYDWIRPYSWLKARLRAPVKGGAAY